MKKICIIAVSLLLVSVMAIIFVTHGILPCIAASETNLYIKEIKISSAQTEAEAKKWLTDNNYIVFDHNLNEGTDYSYTEIDWSISTKNKKAAVYLGYKTTTKKEEGITDIELMNMDGGYKIINYFMSSEGSYKSLTTLVDNFTTMCLEFKENYDNKIYTTDIAFELLKNYYVPDTTPPDPEIGSTPELKEWYAQAGYTYVDSKTNKEVKVMRLSYYLCEVPSLSEYQIKELILTSNSNIMTTFFMALAKGLSINGNDENWLNLLSKNGPETDNDDLTVVANAEKLIPAATELSKGIKGALERRNSGKTGTSEQQTNDLINYGCYILLQNHPYGSGTLADIFTRTDGGTEGWGGFNKADLVAMAKILTPGQFASIQTTGIAILLASAEGCSLPGEQPTNTKPISIKSGVNTDIYKSDVALTGASYRSAAAGDAFSDLTASKADDKAEYEKTLTKLEVNFASAVAAAAITVAQLALPAFTYAATVVIGTVAKSICASLTGMLSTAAAVNGFVFLAVLLYYAVTELWDYYQDYKEYYHPTYTEIPMVMYDLVTDGKDTNYVEYDVVTGRDVNSDGNVTEGAGDLNGWIGQQWLAMYTTTDPDAGDPILVTDLDNPFVIQTGNGQTPDGEYGAVSQFGQCRATNTNSYAYKDTLGGIYLFFRVDGTIKTAVNNGKYISEIKIACADNEFEAIYQLENEKFTVVDINLTAGLYTAGEFYSTLTYAIDVRDTVAPVLTLSGDVPKTANVGEEVKLPTAVVTDNVSVNLKVYLYVIDESGKMSLCNNNKFTFAAKGNYVVRYFTKDSDYNYVIEDFVISVK